MELTDIHIQELYKFTRKHFVEHYDVQSELVDHLANDIEEISNKKPSLSFDEARNISFKKFGVFGFMNVVEQKQKAMNKRYRKILWRFFKDWFTLPKVVITITILLTLFFILKIQYSKYILLGALFILVAFDLIKQIITRKKLKNREQKKDTIFLLESMIGNTRTGFSGFATIHIFNSINIIKVPFDTLENHWLLLISFSATLLIILFYITGYLIPQKAEELLQETYPEYKTVQKTESII
jgi:ABC-type multidrug transport system fused ATPase/permease subunit